MQEPTFSVIAPAKNEKNREFLNETFDNWELARQLFGQSVEFIVVDAGGNVEFPEIDAARIIPPEEYRKYKRKLYDSGIIKHIWWDSPSIGRNLGFRYAKGKIIVFQDIDSLFSTGTDIDYEYITELDEYDNWFKAMYQAFKTKNIVAAASSLRPNDTQKASRRFGVMGLNIVTRISMKLPPVKICGTPVIGPSIPGCGLALLHNVASKMSFNGIGPYDPTLAIGEDYKLSRSVRMYGRLSYEKKAGIFTRTLNRISHGFDITKCLFYAIKWLPHYVLPGYSKYQKHGFSI